MNPRLPEPAFLIEMEANAPWFSAPHLGELMLAQINAQRQRGDFRLHAFILLPRTWQAILTPKDRIQTVLQQIRESTTEGLALAGCQVRWKGRIKDQIEDAWELLLLCGELHLAPVRAGLVEDPEAYPFSSLYTLDVDEIGLPSLTGEGLLG